MKKRFCRSIVFLICLATLWPSEPILAQEAARPSPTEADEFTATMQQARSFLVNGKVNEAIAAYRKASALRDGKCAECFQYLGQIYFQMSQYGEAAAMFRQAIALKPHNEAALANFLGVALYLQDDRKVLAEAVEAFRHAIELSGDKIPKAHYNRGHALLKLGRTTEGIAEFKRFLELEPKAESAQEVKAIVANPKLAGAKFAADFEVKDATGAPISLKSLRGKIVLLDFWAVWCGPCRAEMPAVKRIAQKYAAEPLVILGISLDRDRKAFEEYQRQEGMNWPQFFDGKGWGNQIAQLYRVSRIPHTVLIDQDGIIRATGLRGEQLSNKIGELLKQLRSPQ
jgi:thiol-disulfide isomerase/thioredoxin